MDKNTIPFFESLMQDYLSGSMSAEEMRRLAELLRNDPACREMFRDSLRAYGMASMPLFEQRKEENLHALRKRLGMPTARRASGFARIGLWRAAAACALLIGTAWMAVYLLGGTHRAETLPEPSYCHVKVPQGSRTELRLPDSTLVCLNGGAELTYDSRFALHDKRCVALTGEAYFKVSKDAKRPFIVNVGQLQVKVLGTTFNVSAYSDRPDIIVSLVEGSVQVLPETETGSGVTLTPNEQAVYHKANRSITVSQVSADLYTAWATRKLNFTNEALGSIWQAIAKEYGVKIQIRTRKVDKEFFTGSIDLNLPLDVVLSYLDVDRKFGWKREGNTLTVYDR